MGSRHRGFGRWPQTSDGGFDEQETRRRVRALRDYRGRADRCSPAERGPSLDAKRWRADVRGPGRHVRQRKCAKQVLRLAAVIEGRSHAEDRLPALHCQRHRRSGVRGDAQALRAEEQLHRFRRSRRRGQLVERVEPQL